MKRTILLSLLIAAGFMFANTSFASVSSGTIDPSYQYVKVCHDVTCATTAGGSYGIINMRPTGFTPIRIDDTTGVTGQAWGNELGTITFNPIGGGVTINTSTGAMSGYAYAATGGWMKLDPIGVTPVTVNCSGELNGWAWIGGVNGGWVKFSASGIASPSTPADAGATVKTDWIPTSCRPSGGGVILTGGGGGGAVIDQCPNLIGYQSTSVLCPVILPTNPQTPPVNPPTGTEPTTPPKNPPTKPPSHPEQPTFEITGETPVKPTDNPSLVIKHVYSESGKGIQIPPRFLDVKVTTIDPKDKTKKIVKQEKGLFYEFVQSTNDHVSVQGKDFVKTKVTFSYVGKLENTQRIVYQSRGIRGFFAEFVNIQKVVNAIKNFFGIPVVSAAERNTLPVSEFTGNSGSVLIPEETGLYTMRIEGTHPNGLVEVINVSSIVVPKGSVFYRWWWFGWHEKPISEARATLYARDSKTGNFVHWTEESYEEAASDETYVFILPQGEYYLEINAPKFHMFRGETISLLQNGHVVNDKVELLCSFWSSYWCLLPIKVIIIVVIIALVVYIVYRRRKHKENKKDTYQNSFTQ